MRATCLIAAFATLCLSGCSSDSTIDAASDGSGSDQTAAASDEVLAPPPGVDRTTSRIEAAVLAQLAADPDVDATEFDVELSDGTLVISTSTESAAAWARAEALARLVEGVTAVQMATTIPEGSAGGLPTETHALDDAFAVATAFGTPPAEPLGLEPEVVDGSGEGDGLAEAASGDRPRTYVVGPGDSLSIIAQRTMGDGLAWPQLYEFNRSVIGADPGALRQGMELRIPQD